MAFGRPQTKAKVEAPMKLLDEIRAYNGTLTYQDITPISRTYQSSSKYKGT